MIIINDDHDIKEMPKTVMLIMSLLFHRLLSLETTFPLLLTIIARPTTQTCSNCVSTELPLHPSLRCTTRVLAVIVLLRPHCVPLVHVPHVLFVPRILSSYFTCPFFQREKKDNLFQAISLPSYMFPFVRSNEPTSCLFLSITGRLPSLLPHLCMVSYWWSFVWHSSLPRQRHPRYPWSILRWVKTNQKTHIHTFPLSRHLVFTRAMTLF